jgi:FkbH-like protein
MLQAADINRVFELLQRTNQLNATLTRTSLDELRRQQQHAEGFALITARLADRFGDYGLIGFGSATKSSERWHLGDLAFSCRSMGRGVERALVLYINELAAKAGAQFLTMDFRVGARNLQMLNILRESGFVGDEDTALTDGATVRLRRPVVGRAATQFPEWLSVSTQP